MSATFSPARGLIIVRAELVGPTGNAVVRLALDTGATTTLINVALFVAVGYDPALAPTRVQITTGSGVEYVPQLTATALTALGRMRQGLPILAHTLPTSAGIDGLLGLDFFRNTTLTIDFRTGQVRLV